MKTAGLSVLAAPLLLPSRLRGSAANSRVRVGQIGCGRIAREHDIPGVIASGLAEYVAVADLDLRRRDAGRSFIEQRQPGGPVGACRDYRELLARPDIDAVVISTPDHWHAQLTLEAIYAGKDVYQQKPMTITVAEGIRLRDEIGRTDRIYQLGSQQRSWGPNEQFRKAVECVRSGRVGQLRRIEIGLPVDGTAPDQAQEPVPPAFDYERWLGPTPAAYYTQQRVHPQSGFGRPGWMRTEAHCLGMITNWGAHHLDIAQWAMDVERSGPHRVEATAVFPHHAIWNVHGDFHVELSYPRGVKVVVSPRFPNGLRFIGDDGWIFCTREGTTTASDPFHPAGRLKPLDASDPRLLDQDGLAVRLPSSREHHLNWLQCVRSRRTPLVPAPIAHRSNTACVISWIAMKCGRPLTWDPAQERFADDAAANAMLSLPERPPYGIETVRKT